MHGNDPLAWDAHRLSRALHARELSCRELMAATLARIGRHNPRFNAIVNLADGELLLRQADAADAELARGHSRGFMHGMPLAVKDAAHATGFPTTYGSPLLRTSMPAADSLIVQRMKAAGALVIGKTNIPEFGLGSHSYNTVFGVTRNAWDPTRTAGGSSGGAAVALALRLVALADGSDFMGSLRNPAGWNHVFGLRPSQGRVPAWPKPDPWVSQLVTEGPMARTVRDLARLLDIQAGFDPRVPLSLAREAGSFVPGEDATVRGLRVGWLGDLGGHLATEAGVLPALEAALARLAAGGAQVEPATLGVDLAAVWEAWLVWRRALVAPNVAAVLTSAEARAQVKPEALWEHDQAQGLSFEVFLRASGQRSALLNAMLALFTRFDVLALPVAQVWPFEVETTWPRAIAGRAMDTYHRWMETTLYATFAGLPGISVPAGFGGPGGAGRWPIGLQLIGPPRADAALLRAAAGYEALIGESLQELPPALADSSRPSAGPPPAR